MHSLHPQISIGAIFMQLQGLSESFQHSGLQPLPFIK